MQAGARPLRTHRDRAGRRGAGGGLRQVGHTHACLRSMTPCQNIKCMLWLLSQMCVRFFKSIDSGWINGNRGVSFFFFLLPPLCKKRVITLCREAPGRGGKSKCSTRSAFYSSAGHQGAQEEGQGACLSQLALPAWRRPPQRRAEGLLGCLAT